MAPQIASPPTAPIFGQLAVHEPFGNPPTEPDALERLHLAATPLGTVQPLDAHVEHPVAMRIGLERHARGLARIAGARLPAGTHMPTSSPLTSLQVKPLAQVHVAKLGSPRPQCAP